MKKFLFAIVTSALIMGETQAIEPVYDGEDGIKAQVFATNCLTCHSSELTGDDRNGAPEGADFDSYSDSLIHDVVKRAVTNMDMPPAASSQAVLTDEQKLALSNWKALDFPENTMPPVYSATPATLTLPKVYVKDADGVISSKVMAELALKGVQPFQFEVTHLHDIEDDSAAKDDHGCVPPATWHEEMGHCMVQ
jgi:mono/diheme cytochrome c family protein